MKPAATPEALVEALARNIAGTLLPGHLDYLNLEYVLRRGYAAVGCPPNSASKMCRRLAECQAEDQADADAFRIALATATAEAASLRAEVEAVLDEFEPRILRDRLLPSESIADRVRHIAYEAVDGRAGEAGLLKTVERYEAANLALRAEVEAKDRVAGCLRASVRELAQTADRAKAEAEALKAGLTKIEARSRHWIMRDAVKPDDVIVQDDGQHSKVLVLAPNGREAHAALARAATAGEGRSDA